MKGSNKTLVVVNPAMILGPLAYKPEMVNTSNMLVMSLMYGMT